MHLCLYAIYSGTDPEINQGMAGLGCFVEHHHVAAEFKLEVDKVLA